MNEALCGGVGGECVVAVMLRFGGAVLPQASKAAQKVAAEVPLSVDIASCLSPHGKQPQQ